MANAESKEGEFVDLGRFKSKKCKKVGTVVVCQTRFENGTFTLTEKELNKICKSKK